MRLGSSLTFADKVLIAGSVCLIVASYVLANATTSRGSAIIVQVDGKTVYKASLSEAHVFVVQGVLGPVTIETRNGKAAVTHSGCPNHICERTGWRSSAGEVIVCVPNKVVVRIVGDAPSGVRATTG